ncbi:MAG: hypothetical protein P8X47_05265 [Ignavibacteriaceae bacterium]
MSNESKYFSEVTKKLESFIRKEYLQWILFGVQIFVIAVLANFTFYAFLELKFAISSSANFSSIVRTILFVLFILVLLSLFFFLLIKPLRKYFGAINQETFFEAAEKTGKHFPEVKDELLNSMQLVSENNKKGLYSYNLIDAAFKNVYNRIKNLNFQSIINFEQAKKLIPYFAGITFVCLALLIFVPGMRAASFRIINFNKEFIPPPKYTFEVTPGNKEITKGDDLNISVKVNGPKLKEILFAKRNIEEASFTKQKLLPDSSGVFNLKMDAVKSSFKYFAEADGVSSDLFEIKVIDRPVVKTLDLEIIPPAYSGIPKTVQKDNGNVQALVGSRVKLNISSTKKLNEANLEFSDSTKTGMKTNEESAAGFFNIKKDNSYKIALIDENGNANIAPITYEIKVTYDAFPEIELVAPNKNVMLANDNRVALLAKTSDDYGFSRLHLNYRLSSSKYELPQDNFTSVEIPINKSQLEQDISYIWNCTPLNLSADDVVTYYLEVFDNDIISGPKSARTQSFTIRVPSLNEILNNANELQAQSETELEETLKEAADLKKNLEDISNELKKDDQKLTWEEKQKIENAMDKYQELQNKVDKINDQIGDMKQNLQENNLLSKETMEKYMELQKLMDEMTSDEMKKAMERLQNLFSEMNRKMTQDALQDFKFDEEKINKSIERTLNLLKRIQIEQKMDELIKRTENLKEQQENLKEQTKKSNPSDQNEMNDFSKKQDEITKDLNKLEEEMKNLQEKMSEISGMPMEEMEKLMQEFQQQQNQQLSEQSSSQLKQCQMQNANRKQQQLSSNMNQMNQMMQQLKNSMQQQNQMQTFTDMMKILDNIISLSKDQEDLKSESEQLEPNSSEFDKLAEKEKNLSNNLNNIMQEMSDLSQKTFAISPEMGKSLGDAKRQMEMSIESMKGRNGMMSSNQQGEAMKSLNESALMMKNSMEAMMQGGSQGGMMSLMQQLQQMSGQQMNLNNLTQMLQQMKQGGLSPQQQAQMQRLGQQQELIKKSLDQLNQEAKVSGQSKKLPVDLDEIAKKMQEVITDLRGEKLDDNLVQKQEHILNKLLDAQKSINERDYEKQRESRSGQTVLRDSPQELDLTKQSSQNKIRDELNKAVKEGYLRDYEDLIRKYYEALQEQKVNSEK